MNRKTKFPTQAMLTIRVVVGGYVLYLAYTLIRDRATSTMPKWALITSLIIFIVGGIGVIAHSVYLYIKGMYVGGKADVEEEIVQEAEKTPAIEADVTPVAEDADVTPVDEADVTPETGSADGEDA